MIFNKDGKVYILKGPNPLVDKQENWDSSKLVFHNFDWDDIRIKSAAQVKKVKTDIKNIKETKIEEIKIEAPSSTQTPEPTKIPLKIEEPKQQEIEKSFDLPYIKYKVLSYCLPVILETRTDDFYGERWGRLKYGKKFVFPSVVISSTDFSIEFWTSDPNEQITEGSIIYPFSYEVHNQETESYDKVPYDEYRWWKVSEKEKKEEGGWLFKATPSETQPDFSS
jgi:hypothetical protein